MRDFMLSSITGEPRSCPLKNLRGFSSKKGWLKVWMRKQNSIISDERKAFKRSKKNLNFLMSLRKWASQRDTSNCLSGSDTPQCAQGRIDRNNRASLNSAAAVKSFPLGSQGRKAAGHEERFPWWPS